MCRLRIAGAMVMNLIVFSGVAQTFYMTRSGQVSFFSTTPLENIKAVNNEVSSILNAETGDIVFAVLIKSFRFERALMEEHFNENYLESDKMPKSTFQGKITNVSSIDFKNDGTFPATAEGDLTIHGVKRHIVSSGNIVVDGGKIFLQSTFTIKLADYNVERPFLVADKIAETIDVSLKCQYDPKS